MKIDMEHAANYAKCCIVLEEELENIRCSTENGYLIGETLTFKRVVFFYIHNELGTRLVIYAI